MKLKNLIMTVTDLESFKFKWTYIRVVQFEH